MPLSTIFQLYRDGGTH